MFSSPIALSCCAQRHNMIAVLFVKLGNNYRTRQYIKGKRNFSIFDIDGILPKGPYPPCLRMEGRALLVGYPRY